MAPNQSVWIDYRLQTSGDDLAERVDRGDDTTLERRVQARWTHNEGDVSYWQAFLGPFARGRLCPKGT